MDRIQEAQDREEKRKSDELLVRWTFALFVATVGLMLATVLLGYFTHRQAQDMKESIAATRHSAEAAAKSADAAEKSLIAANRAWVKVDLRVGGPILFDPYGGAILTFVYILENVGNSPALEIIIGAKIVDSNISIYNELLEFIESSRRMVAPFYGAFGDTLFPGEKMERTIPTTVWADQLKAITTRHATIFPAVIGNIMYKTGLDDIYHQTAFALDIRRSNTPRPFTIERNYPHIAICLEEGDVPADDVRLFRSEHAGEYAD